LLIKLIFLDSVCAGLCMFRRAGWLAALDSKSVPTVSANVRKMLKIHYSRSAEATETHWKNAFGMNINIGFLRRVLREGLRAAQESQPDLRFLRARRGPCLCEPPG
jgi:hypothetical protein